MITQLVMVRHGCPALARAMLRVNLFMVVPLGIGVDLMARSYERMW
jgi:hypothetical protein